MSRSRNDGYRQAYVKCPFYRGYTKNAIKCEGFMEGVGNTVTFADHKDHSKHMDVFCQMYYKNCEVYQMVMKARYEE
jgi:hypothetical protein